MKFGKNKWLTTSLEICLYVILFSGIVFLLAKSNATPSVLKVGVIILIKIHKILGFIFLALILWHALTYRKWYKAWFSGKIKNKKSLFTKSISVLFLILTFALFFENIVPHKIYTWGHIIIGTIWIAFIILHIRQNKTFK